MGPCRNSLPEFLDCILFGKTESVGKMGIDMLKAIHSLCELTYRYVCFVV